MPLRSASRRTSAGVAVPSGARAARPWEPRGAHRSSATSSGPMRRATTGCGVGPGRPGHGGADAAAAASASAARACTTASGRSTRPGRRARDPSARPRDRPPGRPRAPAAQRDHGDAKGARVHGRDHAGRSGRPAPPRRLWQDGSGVHQIARAAQCAPWRRSVRPRRRHPARRRPWLRPRRASRRGRWNAKSTARARVTACSRGSRAAPVR